MTDQDRTKRVLEHLIKEHTGRHNAVTQAKLAKSLNMNESSLRSEIRRFRESSEIPIANLKTGEGYFIIQNKEELQDYVATINSEIETRRNRIKYTVEAFENFDHEDAVASDGGVDVIEETYTCAKCGGDVPKDERRYPRNGDYADEPCCKHCYGELVMAGEA